MTMATDWGRVVSRTARRLNPDGHISDGNTMDKFVDTRRELIDRLGALDGSGGYPGYPSLLLIDLG